MLDFLAMHRSSSCHNLGVEIEENSELDLFEAFNKHANDQRIPDVVKDMEQELGRRQQEAGGSYKAYCVQADAA